MVRSTLELRSYSPFYAAAARPSHTSPQSRYSTRAHPLFSRNGLQNSLSSSVIAFPFSECLADMFRAAKADVLGTKGGSRCTYRGWMAQDPVCCQQRRRFQSDMSLGKVLKS